MSEERIITWEEVKKHNSAESLWVVVNGKVYDVTEFATEVHSLCSVSPMGIY